MTTQQFTATVEAPARGGVAIKLPFDPSAEWGDKDRHDVIGTIGGRKVRGRLILVDGGHYLELGPAWFRDSSLPAGAPVAVSLSPEGPQVASLAPDLATALEAEPAARRFFESLPTFYRKNFVRWIEESKRQATRARRIAEAVATLTRANASADQLRSAQPDVHDRRGGHMYLPGRRGVFRAVL